MRKKLIGVLSLIVISGFFAMSAISIVAAEELVGKGWNAIIDKTMTQTNALNSVTAVVFDFRGYDTFGEALVLFTAIFGVSAILRKTRSKGGD